MTSRLPSRSRFAFLSMGALASFFVCALACGGVEDSTACAFDPACSSGTTSDSSTSDTTVSGDTTPGDSALDTSGPCTPGEVKPAGDGCNTCTCNSKRVFECTKKVCPSTCPTTAPAKGTACVGSTHCIFKNPAGCPFGCDCVSGGWLCVDPLCPDAGAGCPASKPEGGTACDPSGLFCTYSGGDCKCDTGKWNCSGG